MQDQFKQDLKEAGGGGGAKCLKPFVQLIALEL